MHLVRDVFRMINVLDVMEDALNQVRYIKWQMVIHIARFVNLTDLLWCADVPLYVSYRSSVYI